MPAKVMKRFAESLLNILTTFTVNVIKNYDIEWPRLGADDFIMAIGSTRPLENVCRIAYRELIYWLERDFGFERYDAYMMLSQCGKVCSGNFVDPKYTIGAAIPKKYISRFFLPELDVFSKDFFQRRHL